MKGYLKPEYFFLIAGLVFGLAMIVLTPPFQVPDEFNHFYRAYQISEGQLIPTRTENRLGGELPKSLRSFSQPFEKLVAQPSEKISFREIAKADKDLNPTQRIWYDFPNTAIYSFLNYLPQAAGIAIVRPFTSSPLAIFYGSRIFTLLYWISMIFWTIRISPIFKWLLVALALLPMSIYINSSVSGDVVNNAICFLFIGWVFKVRFTQDYIKHLQLIVLLAFTALIASLKMVYTPLLLLLLLIPPKHFQSGLHYWGSFAVTFSTAVIFAALSYYSIDQLYIPYAEYAPAAGWVHLVEGADKNRQMEYMLENGVYSLEVIFNTIIHTFPMYAKGYIGTFGWLEFGLPFWTVVTSYLFLMLIAVSEPAKFSFGKRFKILYFSAFILMLILVIISQHLNWDVVGDERVWTLQGRYFTPVFPLFFMLFYNQKIQLKNALAWITPIFMSALVLYSLVLVFKRFFG